MNLGQGLPVSALSRSLSQLRFVQKVVCLCVCVLTIYQRAGPSRQFVIDEISAFNGVLAAQQRELCVLCSVQLCTCVCVCSGCIHL